MPDPDPRSTRTTPPAEPVEITSTMTPSHLIGCSLVARCTGRCGYLTVMNVKGLADRFGLDARLGDLAPKFRCSRCRGAAELTVERMRDTPVGPGPRYR